MKVNGSKPRCRRTAAKKHSDAHTARKTEQASNDFVDRRLLQLIAFWSLQLHRNFDLGVFLTFRRYIILQLSTCYWRFLLMCFVPGVIAFCKRCCRIQTKSLQHWCQNPSKIHPKTIKNQFKTIPNRPKWCPGAFRKRPREQVGSTCFPPTSFWSLFGATWAILGVIWRPAGRQGVPKSKKMSSRMRQQKKYE